MKIVLTNARLLKSAILVFTMTLLSACNANEGFSATAAGGHLWKINTEDSLVLEESSSESNGGKIRYLHSGRTVATWETGVTRHFGMLAIIGSYPEQRILVPYLVGGGTGLAVYHWVVIVPTESGVIFKDMGLWTFWSCAKESYKFSLSPNLLGRNNTSLDFVWVEKRANKTKIISGTVFLKITRPNAASIHLEPRAMDSGLACLALLDVPDENVRRWSMEVLRSILPPNLLHTLQNRKKGEGSLPNKIQARIKEALTKHY